MHIGSQDNDILAVPDRVIPQRREASAMLPPHMVPMATAATLLLTALASPPAAADSTTAQRIFTVSGEAWCDTAPPNPSSLPVPCGKVTIYGNGFIGEATPAPLAAVVPVQGTFRIENVPGGSLYK